MDNILDSTVNSTMNTTTFGVSVGITAFSVFVALAGIFFGGILIKDAYIRKQVQLAVCLATLWMYVFWLCIFLQQLNPLIGPELKGSEIKAVYFFWDNKSFNRTMEDWLFDSASYVQYITNPQ
ncbi:V-type proton ATPase subunit e-like [Convolutriloba macropyga]|uniref:V-type proton ATPase subunit e-like n=1 Tax=Convolutriloba macropyga TaxID=536237 RepID=UPI003F51C2BC